MTMHPRQLALAFGFLCIALHSPVHAFWSRSGESLELPQSQNTLVIDTSTSTRSSIYQSMFDQQLVKFNADISALKNAIEIQTNELRELQSARTEMIQLARVHYQSQNQKWESALTSMTSNSKIPKN